MRVLLVDDDPGLTAGISRLLRLNRPTWLVLTANGPDEALSILRRQEMHVIIVDMQMPGMNGIELAGEVHKYWPSVPLIMLTGNADLDVAKEAINKGGYSRFFEKPCDTSELLSSMEELCGKVERKKHADEDPLRTDRSPQLGLSELPLPFLLVNRELALIEASTVAVDWMKRERLLFLDRGDRLRAAVKASQAALVEGIKQAIGAGARTVLRLDRDEGHVTSALISPLRYYGDAESLAIIAIAGDAGMSRTDPGSLTQIFALTEAEARLACEIAAGQSIEKASLALQITVGTA